MKPKSVNVLGVPYTIEYCDNPSNVDIFKRDAVWGQTDYWTRSIRVYDNNTPIEDVWHTIIHEILHCIADALKLKLNEEENHDELDILSLAILDVMIRNEWFIPINGDKNGR